MTANKSIPPPSLDKQTRPQTPYTITATLRSPCAQPNNAPPPHPTPPPHPRNERKKRRYNYNQTDIISAHSHCTVRLAVTLTSWVPMPLRAVQTYTPLSSHLAITLYVRGDNSLCTSVPLARLTSLTVGVGRPSPAAQSNVTLWVSWTTTLPCLPFSVREIWLGGSET